MNGVRTAKRFFLQYLECGASQYGGMLAYSLFVSLIPLMLGVVSIFGLVSHGPGHMTQLRLMLVEIFPPELHGPVREALVTASQHAGTIFVLSLVGLAWFSTGLFSTVGFALNQIYRLPSRTFWQQRLRGLLLVAVLVASVAIAATVDFFIRYLGLPGVIGLFGIWIALVYLIGFLYRFAPALRMRLADVWPGAAGAALVIVAAGYALTVTTSLTFRLATDTRFFAEVFALAAWVYFIAQAILMGAFFNRFVVEARVPQARPSNAVAIAATSSQAS